jgi:DNA-binding CsgD family transcriptional regulator|tara:strand:+ start:8952 stop:12644 length:3693 start_codon:yes stop_codon:yes gene_type:complete
MSVPMYKVNPQTGDVVKDDGSGWKPVSSARNKQTGQIVVDEGAGWRQIVRSEDGGWSLAGGTPTNPQAPQAAVRARESMSAGLPVDQGDLSTLTQPNLQPLTPAEQAYAQTPQRRLERQVFEQQAQSEIEQARVPDSNLKERSIMAMNGPTLGNGPRLAAGAQTAGAMLTTPFVKGDIIDRKGVGGAADQFLDEARTHQRRARDERAGESLALEVVPAFFQGKSLLDLAGKSLLKKGTAVNNTARVMGTGAVSGATYMGSQNESGTAQGALQDAGVGALYGAGAGAGFKGAQAPTRIAYRSAKTGAATLRDALASALGKAGGARDKVAAEVAVAAVNRSADRAGLTMDQMMELVKKYEGKPAVLAEVIGQDAINALTALTRTLGKTSQKAQDIIEERSYGWYDRAKGDIEDATGIAPGQVDEIVEEGMKEGRKKARPFYEELYSQFKNVKSFPESLKRVNRLLRSPGMERHKALAEKAVRNAAAKRGIPLSKMSKMEYFDLIKQSLDDAIDAAASKGENRTRVGESVRDLVELKDEFVKELDRLTGGTYAAAREAGGEAPRLRQAAVGGQRAFGARNPRVVAQTVENTTPEALPALQAGMVDDLSTRIDKGSLIPGRFRRPDVAGKVRAVFGEETGDEIINKMDAEATLRETGSRWAPRLNSVTGTVMESGPTQMGDDLMNAGMNLMTGNKLGLLRQAINFARQRGFSPRQLDAIGDLLLSDPAEGLKRLGRMRPDGAPPATPAAVNTFAENGKPVQQGPAQQTENVFAPTSAKPVAAGGFAGFGGRRPVGFHDEVPRGSDPFSDPRLTPTENKAVEMAKNGYSNAEIAEELMLSEANGASVVLAKARNKGVDVPTATTGRPPEARDRILELAQRGARPSAIAEMTGKSVNTVKVTLSKARKALRDAGEELPDWLKPRTDLSGTRFSGLQASQNDLGNAAVGGAIGGVHPDFDGDGEVTAGERIKGIAIGAGGMAVAGRIGPSRATASAGAGGRPPKIKKDVPLGTGPRNGRRLGRGLDDLMRDQAPQRPPIELPQNTPPRSGSRLGRGLDDLMQDVPPAREPASPLAPPNPQANLPRGLREPDAQELLDNPISTRNMPHRELRERMDRSGYDWQNSGRQHDLEALPVVAGVTGGVAALTGGAALSMYLNRNVESEPGVPPELAKARQEAAMRAAEAYQKDPNSRDFQIAMIRVQQIDREIGDMGRGNIFAGSGAPPPPSRKPTQNVFAR